MRAVQCRKCFYTARFQSEIARHERTVHSEIKPIVCKFPDCSFKNKTTVCLKAHQQRTHEAKLELRKPFPCDFPNCEYRADSQRDLSRHVRARHTPGKTRDLQCPMCPSKFGSERAICSHNARHVKETRFNCVHCEFRTHDHGSLSTHVKLVHKNFVNLSCFLFLAAATAPRIALL